MLSEVKDLIYQKIKNKLFVVSINLQGTSLLVRLDTIEEIFTSHSKKKSTKITDYPLVGGKQNMSVKITKRYVLSKT